MRILYQLFQPTPPGSPAEKQMNLLKKIADVDTSPFPETKEEWLEKIKDVSVTGSIRLPAGFQSWDELLDAAPKLAMMQIPFVGYDHVQAGGGLDSCTRHGIIVCNVAEDMSEAVAQHAMALIMDLSKNVSRLDRSLRRTRSWEKALKEARVGFELWGKTLGVIGLGNIGGRLAMKCRTAFNMRVIACDPFLYPAGAQRYGAELVDLPTLLKESDIISVHTFLARGGPNPTYHLLGAKEFGMMKKTAVLVNTSRGPVIDEPALFEALKNGKIAGAGLDVFETEPIAADNPLFDLDNVVLTPHTSSSTVEAGISTPASALENVIRFIQGKAPWWMINPIALPQARAKINAAK